MMTLVSFRADILPLDSTSTSISFRFERNTTRIDSPTSWLDLVCDFSERCVSAVFRCLRPCRTFEWQETGRKSGTVDFSAKRLVRASR